MALETVYICIRRTADWKNAANYRARLIAQFVPHVDAWDATFCTTYREFRAAIAEITMASLQAVRGAIIAPYEEIPEGAIVMPCDDDDWTAPHAAEILAESFSSHHDRAIWTQSVLQVPLDWMHALKIRAGKIWPRLNPPRWLCSTNNYALRKRSENFNSFMSHMLASKEWAVDPKLLRLRRCLSLQNRNPASKTSMVGVRYSVYEQVNGQVRLANLNESSNEKHEPSCARPSRHLLRKLEKYRELYQSYKPENPDLEWATPYVHAMRDLTLSLKTK
jgi:hypothetical protein